MKIGKKLRGAFALGLSALLVLPVQAEDDIQKVRINHHIENDDRGWKAYTFDNLKEVYNHGSKPAEPPTTGNSKAAKRDNASCNPVIYATGENTRMRAILSLET